jgi:hypothetical protein
MTVDWKEIETFQKWKGSHGGCRKDINRGEGGRQDQCLCLTQPVSEDEKDAKERKVQEMSNDNNDVSDDLSVGNGRMRN